MRKLESQRDEGSGHKPGADSGIPSPNSAETNSEALTLGDNNGMLEEESGPRVSFVTNLLGDFGPQFLY